MVNNYGTYSRIFADATNFVALPDVLDALQSMSIDLERHTRLVHLHEDFTRTKIPSGIFSLQLDGCFGILESGWKVPQLVVAGRAIVKKLN